MSQFKVALVAYEGEPLPEWVGRELNAAGIEFVARDCREPWEIVPLARDADVIWIRCGLRVVTTDNLDEFRHCGAIIRSGSGTDNVPVAECTWRGIIVVNTSRGQVVDEPALVEALEGGRIAGAGLDVFEHEPLACDHPMLTFPNVVVTPHLGGYSDTFKHDMWRLSVETAIDLSKQRWPASYVNRDVSPRWPMRD